MARRGLTRKDFLKRAGAGVAGTTLLGSSLLGSGCGSSVASSDMNVVVVILDSLRKDHVGAYGNDWIRTPTLDTLASESLRFERAYPEAMPTIPVRRALYTGTRTWTSPAPSYGWDPIPRDQVTLTEILKQKDTRRRSSPTLGTSSR